MLLFALDASAELGSAIADRLGRSLAAHEEREFANGEHKARPLVDVWNRDAAVVSSLHGDAGLSVNDKICRLLFFVGALQDAGARRVMAVLPYLAYSRKDRRTKPRDPVTVRYLATALQSVGVEAIVTVDVHNAAALENASAWMTRFSRACGRSASPDCSPSVYASWARPRNSPGYRALSM